MSDFQSKLREAADKNTELLGILSETEFAGPSWKQNEDYLVDLRSQISATDGELKKLHEVTEDERRDHVKYRDSTVKRFVHRLGGQRGKDKFASRQEKEEREL